MKLPAHAELVRRYLDWGKVEKRLRRYPNLAAHYSLKSMRHWDNRPPYYCHYLAWRMGTWSHYQERVFACLDGLIEVCSQLPGWDANHRLTDARFDAFWSDMWELQVAKGLAGDTRFSSLEWLPSGPDMAVTIGSRRVYVECYVWRKRYVLLTYACELLQCLLPRLGVRRDSCYSPQLPRSASESCELDRFFQPFLAQGRVDCIRSRAASGEPIRLGLAGGTVRIEDPSAPPQFDPRNAYPTFDDLPAACIRGCLSSKADRNDLTSCHPNALFVNTALVPEATFGKEYLAARGRPCTRVELPPDVDACIDAVVLFACGVTERVELARGQPWFPDDAPHPLREL